MYFEFLLYPLLNIVFWHFPFLVFLYNRSLKNPIEGGLMIYHQTSLRAGYPLIPIFFPVFLIKWLLFQFLLTMATLQIGPFFILFMGPLLFMSSLSYLILNIKHVQI